MRRVVLVVLGAMAASLAAGPVAAADGKAVWEKSCAGCHAVLAPKFGDKAAWAPRLAMGTEKMTASVVKGKPPMPPRGGAASEADVEAAVEYLVTQMK